MQPGKLYGHLALFAKHINDNSAKFICLIARGADGKYEVYNGEVVDVDELQGAATAIMETMNDFKDKINV